MVSSLTHSLGILSVASSHCSTVPSCARATLQVCHMLRRVAAAMLFLVHLGYL